VIHIVPRLRSRADLAPSPGKLLATMLSVATAGMLDAVRFRRGREYASTGAVRSLDIDPGVLRGEVQGSRRLPYDVTVRTAMVPPPPPDRAPTSMPTLAPSTSDLRASCTCPDADEGACKHIVAVLLSFADEVSLRPELLVTWRCAEGAAPPRAEIGSRRAARTFGDGGSAARTSAPPSPFETEEWVAFTSAPPGAPDVLEAAAEVAEDPSPLSLGNERVGTVDVSAMLRSALQAMRAAGDVL
jgi:hypothetical protein